jgi:hypothetical protein
MRGMIVIISTVFTYLVSSSFIQRLSAIYVGRKGKVEIAITRAKSRAPSLHTSDLDSWPPGIEAVLAAMEPEAHKKSFRVDGRAWG